MKAKRVPITISVAEAAAVEAVQELMERVRDQVLDEVYEHRQRLQTTGRLKDMTGAEALDEILDGLGRVD